MTPTALTIAGSDPSGGAGIQRDLRTFSAHSVAGLSVITAITAQNSHGVQSIHAVNADILAEQLFCILEDTRPNAVKIGMLVNAQQVRVVAEALRRFRPPNVILDPVLASSGGVSFLDHEGQHVMLTDLMPLCDLVTPNLDEAAILTGLLVHDSTTMEAAAEKLLASGAKAVLIKGGHLTGAPHDTLFVQQGAPTQFLGSRVDTEHTHGTGCLLSSAIAASLARGTDLHTAIHEAKALASEALLNPVILGKGRGYPDTKSLNHPGATIVALDGRVRDRLSLLQGLYVLTDPHIRPDRSAEQVVEAALQGGANIIQMRDKSLPTQELVELARRLCEMVHAAGKLFLVNDRVDIALASNADGVHLGPDDIHPADARRLLGPNKLVGVSTDTLEEAIAAAPYASYFGVGAIFGTQTKHDAGAPVGIDRMREIKAAFPHIPIVPIGGINAENLKEVSHAGADAIAVVSAVVAAPNIEQATSELVSLYQQGKSDKLQSITT